MTNYINERQFCDFKENFHLLVETLNHSVTDLKDDARETKKQVSSIAKSLAKIEGSLAMTNKIVWWVLGIFSAVIVASIIGAVLN